MTKEQEKAQKRIMKEALQNEVRPYLVAIAEQHKKIGESMIKELGTKLTGILEEAKKKEEYDYEVEIDASLKDKLKGDPGYTPKKGVDYYTQKEVAALIKQITPVLGVDYFTEKQIQKMLKQSTPKKGVDFVDGYTPVKGKDYFTKAEIKEFLEAITPIKGIHYHDGKVVTVEKKVTEKIEMSPEEIRNKLESLSGGSRLKMSAIKGLKEAILEIHKGMTNMTAPVFGMPGGGSDDGGGGASSYWDNPYGNATFTYNVDNTVHTKTVGTTTLTFSYNVDKSINTITDGVNTKTFSYDVNGNVQSIVYS